MPSKTIRPSTDHHSIYVFAGRRDIKLDPDAGMVSLGRMRGFHRRSRWKRAKLWILSWIRPSRYIRTKHGVLETSPIRPGARFTDKL